MTVRQLTLLVACLVAVFAAAGSAFRADEKHEHTPLEDSMDLMNKAFKTLKTDVGDASKNASNLAAISEMQKQAVISKGFIPARAAKLNGAEKEKFVTEYRKAMVGLIGEYLKIEAALLDGKNSAAEELVKNLSKIKADGHDKFQEE